MFPQREAMHFRKEGNTQAFASLLEDAGVTRAYEQSSFDHGPIYFTGAANATPEPASGKGPFERLVVSVGVFTPGGMCSWFGDLQSGRTDVEFLNNYGQLPKGAGRITLTFDGYKISDTSDGKPLDIGKVGISCGGSQQITHLEKPIALPPFPQSTFVKAAPGFELVAVERLGSMERGKITTMFLRIETQGGFDQTVDLSIDGLPDGVEARNFPRNVPARALGGVTYQLVIAPNVPLAGLDQVNVLLPHRLAGSGSSPVVLSIAGSIANTLRVPTHRTDIIIRTQSDPGGEGRSTAELGEVRTDFSEQDLRDSGANAGDFGEVDSKDALQFGL
jgi:hypothetical protein